MTLLMLDYQRSGRPLPRTGIALLLAAAIWAAAIAAAYSDLGREATAWRAAEASRPPAPAPATPLQDEAAARDLAREIRQANEVLREIGVPWDALFAAVEAAAGRDIALLAMEPDPKKQVVNLAGEARNLGALVEYMRRLGRQPVLRDVQLQRHEVDRQDPDKPVRFHLQLSWRGRP